MTLGKILNDVRGLVNDTKTPYRWKDDGILGFIKDAVKRLNNIRPASRYDAETGNLHDAEWPATGLSAFPLPTSCERWSQGIVYYAAARCLELDASDTINQTLAADFMGKAEAMFQT